MLSTDMDHAAWALASVAISSALVRLILGVLTVLATRKALSASDGSRTTDRLRAHRLAVLHALLSSLRLRR
jgi:hypothetical protein